MERADRLKLAKEHFPELDSTISWRGSLFDAEIRVIRYFFKGSAYEQPPSYLS
jgi:hypothetical protein